jgi:type IV secretion system protein TrbL
LGASLSVANTSRNIRDAANVAGMEGKSGFGKAAGMAKTLWGARQDAKTAGEKKLSTRTRSEMQERLERAKMSQNDKT